MGTRKENDEDQEYDRQRIGPLRGHRVVHHSHDRLSLFKEVRDGPHTERCGGFFF